MGTSLGSRGKSGKGRYRAMTFDELPTPCYVVDENKIEENLKILKGVMERTGARILLAQKAFSMYALYPLIADYLCGAASSGLYEARLCAEEMQTRKKGIENHIYSPAYKESDFDEILKYCDHIVFNSCRQVDKFAARAKAAGKSIGLRINPQCSTQEGHEIYDPCAKGSRLGVTRDMLNGRNINTLNGRDINMLNGSDINTLNGRDINTLNRRDINTLNGRDINMPNESDIIIPDVRNINMPDGRNINMLNEGNNSITEGRVISMLDGLHFHTLCEQDADALAITLQAVEEKFGAYLSEMKWINFGGGHHITKPGYQFIILEDCIKRMQQKYGLTVYLEPGEAIALNAGILVTTVLETISNETEIAILDTSAACHMPDVLEMPYRPPLRNSGKPGEKPYTYRLGGPTCLAGDIIGDYSFDRCLQEGDRLVFEDMAIYTMVKNNTFNGMPLPTIILKKKNGDYTVVKQFGYEDFKQRI